jgi:two-component system, OmpR family, sensor kinase
MTTGMTKMMRAAMTEKEHLDEVEPTEPRPEGRKAAPFARRVASGIRVRLLASYVLLLAIAAFASVLAARQVLFLRLDDRVEEDLQQEVEEFRTLADNGIDPRSGRPLAGDVDALFRVYRERNVPDDDEEVITVPRRGPAQRLGGDNTAGFSFADSIREWRTLSATERGEVNTPVGEAKYVAVPVDHRGRSLGTFVVSIFTADEREQVNEAVGVIALVSTVVLLLGSAAAFSIVGRVLAPLRELRDAARTVSGTEMDRRIDVEGNDEVAELAHTFNRMLDRLAVAFESQRDFVRDVSHELRTPIAVSRGHLELLAAGDLTGEGERRESISLVTGELDRMSRFVDELLLLAKAESPNFLRLETVQLPDLVDELVAKAKAIGERKWRATKPSARSIVADRQRLTQAVMNLIQNAVAHTEVSDAIEIGADIDGDEAVIWVDDSGTGISPSEQRHIFGRFSRGSHSRGRYDGTGIGLAIVRAIAEAHGGRMRLRSRPGQGARFEIIVPIEQEDGSEAEISTIEIGAS